MIVPTPRLGRAELRALEQIWLGQRQIEPLISEAKTWTGSLRRQTLGRVIQASNSIEGVIGSHGQIQDLLLGAETPLTQNTADLVGYQNAMSFVLQLARDGQIQFDQNLIKALHFNLLAHSPDLEPGRYRKGPVYVVDSAGLTVHEGAASDELEQLMRELGELANSARDQVTLVSAAMVHLNLALIHPFKDGNGRMARILQSASLTSDVKLSPVFLSIEEYLAANTADYYRVLAEAGKGTWSPKVDALPWVRFVLQAHWHQISRVKLAAEKMSTLWSICAELLAGLGFHERAIPAVAHVASGFTLTNSSYRKLLAEAQDQVSVLTASRDLATLVELEIIKPTGSTKARSYSIGPRLSRLVVGVKPLGVRIEPLSF